MEAELLLHIFTFVCIDCNPYEGRAEEEESGYKVRNEVQKTSKEVSASSLPAYT